MERKKCYCCAAQSLDKILKAPLIYAVALGVIVHTIGWHVPEGVESGLKMLGDAYAATVLLILGFQLGHVKWRGLLNGSAWVAVGLRVVIVPLLSLVCIFILRIHGTLGSILLVQSSMPAAVNTIVLAKLYGSDEELIALTVTLSTIVSFLSLPILIIASRGL